MIEPYFRPHSWVLAAAAIGAVVLKRPSVAKALGAVALADVAGRQLSPEWAALVAGWYPTSSGAASSIAPLRTIEEVRAQGPKTVHEVAAQAMVPSPRLAPRLAPELEARMARGAAAREEFLTSNTAYVTEPSVANYRRQLAARQEWDRVNGSPVGPDPTADEVANVAENYRMWKLASKCPSGTQQKSGGCSAFADGSCPPGMERNTMSWHRLDQSGYPSCVPTRRQVGLKGFHPPSRQAIAGLLVH